MLRRRLGSRRGFTLAEVLTAITVSMLAVFALIGLMGLTFSQKNEGIQRQAGAGERRTATAYITSRLPLASLPLRQAYDTQLEFELGGGGGGAGFMLIWADCTDLTLRAALQPSASAPAPLPATPPAPPVAGSVIAHLKECPATLFTYGDGAVPSAPITDIARRLRATREITVQAPLETGGTLQFTSGVGTAVTAAGALASG